MNKKKRNIIIGVVAAVVVIFAVVFAIFAIPVLSIKDGQILSGVYLGPIDVSNCTKEEAAEKIEEYFKDYNKGKIALKAGSAIEEYDISDLKLSLDNEAVIQSAMDVGRVGNLFERYNAIKKLEHDTITVDIKINVDNDAVEKLLKKFSEEFELDPVEPTMKREKGKFIITEGKPGIVVDREKSKVAIGDYLTEEWLSEKKEVELVAEVKEPKGTAEQLSKIKDVLGTYTTNSLGDSNRAHNLKVAADYVNGTILYPGETFSCVDVMRDEYGPGAGYVIAGIFLNGRAEKGYGGGICQVATTIYVAALYSELEIVQRQAHQMVVSYCPLSWDATMAAGSADFVFKNDLDNPIYIECLINDGVTVNIYGVETRSPSRQVSFENEVLFEAPPIATAEYLPDQPLGYFDLDQVAHRATKAQLWKVVKENGVVVSREVINTSSYRAGEGFYRIGVKDVSEENIEIIKKAVATGNVETAQHAILSLLGNKEFESEIKPPSSETSSETSTGASTENKPEQQ